jgi:hypothetical protein
VKDTIVTAIYFYSPTSRFGGRGYSIEHYQSPFKNLLNLGCNIVVYTHEILIDGIKKFFENQRFEDYVIVDYDLSQFKYSDNIFLLKNKKGLIDESGLRQNISVVDNDRNHHLCLMKPYFISETIKNNYFDSENFYWIDAGLFHHGLIPDCLGGMERLTSIRNELFWPNNEKNLCNPTMIQNLVEKTNHSNLLLFGIENYYPEPTWWNMVTGKNKETHIIGGFFGGKKENIVELVDLYDKKLDIIFDNNLLTLEEEVLSILFVEKFFNNEHLKFKTWYHDMPNERNYFGITPGSDSFYKLFIH